RYSYRQTMCFPFRLQALLQQCLRGFLTAPATVPQIDVSLDEIRTRQSVVAHRAAVAQIEDAVILRKQHHDVLARIHRLSLHHRAKDVIQRRGKVKPRLRLPDMRRLEIRRRERCVSRKPAGLRVETRQRIAQSFPLQQGEIPPALMPVETIRVPPREE